MRPRSESKFPHQGVAAFLKIEQRFRLLLDQVFHSLGQFVDFLPVLLGGGVHLPLQLLYIAAALVHESV